MGTRSLPFVPGPDQWSWEESKACIWWAKQACSALVCPEMEVTSQTTPASAGEGSPRPGALRESRPSRRPGGRQPVVLVMPEAPLPRLLLSLSPATLQWSVIARVYQLSLEARSPHVTSTHYAPWCTYCVLPSPHHGAEDQRRAPHSLPEGCNQKIQKNAVSTCILTTMHISCLSFV